ncbi:competence protein CoiA family protein [Nocardioides aurantiacus]|uniref:Competence protein CoiA-like protein n=1 Tax=Nocardioides aurantiacus TaxID=86796 RepID=A0A3N2CUA2_9ACTN|nr:competence protein CoiA family protein [Nocardioides aurantiacus]ROR91110.1 competence protein CoiA-like protein [Nocardioides aurantiacus]
MEREFDVAGFVDRLQDDGVLPDTCSMVAQPHPADLLAAFQNGERRLVYARYRDSPNAPAYFLVNGTAGDPALRKWVAENLECLISDCPDPRLSLVHRSRSGRRDGFAHRSGSGSHASEGLFHQQAKAMLIAWVDRQYPHINAVPEMPTPLRERRADVMLTWPDGRRAAVEVQYAALTVAAWERRHESYLAEGVTPIWLLGHSGPYLRSARPRSYELPESVAGQVQVQALHEAMTEAGAPVLWVNPLDQSIATPWVCTQVAGRKLAVSVSPGGDRRAHIRVDPLDACRLDPTRGLISPAMDHLARLRAAFADRLAQDATRPLPPPASPRVNAELISTDNAQREKILAQHEVWLASDVRAQFVRMFGEIPELFSKTHAEQDQIEAYPEMWRCILYQALIHGRRLQYLTYDDCFAVLDSHGIDQGPTRRTAIHSFLRHLEEQGILYMPRYGGGAVRIMVLRPLRTLAEGADVLHTDGSAPMTSS